MRLEGTWYSGDSYRYCITEDLLPAEELSREIKDVIVSLRPLYEEFVTIDLYPDGKGEIDQPIFFQFYRDRKFLKTDFYVAEIAIKRQEWTEIYSKSDIAESEIVQLFEEICLKRILPSLIQWKLSRTLYGKKKSKVEKIARANELRKLEKIVTNYLYGEGNVAICIEAIEKILEYKMDYLYVEYLVAFLGYDKEGYQKIKKLFDKLSVNPSVALAMGEAELRGKFGAPDYRKAYEYLTHASKIGSVSANYHIGQMYKYGLYVEKDEQKYQELTMSVYQLLLDADAQWAMPSIDTVLYELAVIEKQKGNLQVSLDYCKKARSVAIDCSIYGGGISEVVEKATLLLYELLEYDEAYSDLFDLYYLCQKPCKVEITVGEDSITAEALEYQDRMMIKCGSQNYRNVNDFLRKYKLNGKQITTLFNDIDNVEVLVSGR